MITCSSWADLRSAVDEAAHLLQITDEQLWFRGTSNAEHTLLPSLMRLTKDLQRKDHQQVEEDIFFEFQARAAELRRLNLSDWDYLFYGRHYGMPTRLLDWTDTLLIAVYFATERWTASEASTPSIWCLNPYRLNAKTWDEHEVILPRYLGLIDEDYWDFSELLTASGPWSWKGPVAIYPIQINDRVRAQRGWFTIHGQDRAPLESQFPDQVVQLVLDKKCIPELKELLNFAGYNRYSVYPDLQNLSAWLGEQNLQWAKTKRKMLPQGGVRKRKGQR